MARKAKDSDNARGQLNPWLLACWGTETKASPVSFSGIFPAASISRPSWSQKRLVTAECVRNGHTASVRLTESHLTEGSWQSAVDAREKKHNTRQARKPLKNEATMNWVDLES